LATHDCVYLIGQNEFMFPRWDLFIGSGFHFG
jgi:hypothetical protein